MFEGMNPDDPRTERVAVFERTKMCKFHILGVCAKGDGCRFAHTKEELQGLPDLARTKLCKSLINTGQCENLQCTYAHTKEELRQPPVPDAAPKKQKQHQNQRLQQLHHMQIQQQLHQQQPQQQLQHQQPQLQQLQQQLQQQQPQQQHQQQQQPQQQALQHQQHLLQHQQLQQQHQQLQQLQQQLLQQQQQAGQQMRMGPQVPSSGTGPSADSQEQYLALVQQMGQAAQAHAAEAARLQAMATQMQAGAPIQSLVGNNMIPFLMPGNGMLGQDGSTFVIQNLGQMGVPQMNAAAEGGPAAYTATGEVPAPWAGAAEDSGPTIVTQSFPEVTSPSPESPNRPTTGLAATMSRVLGNEPVQIRTETLRSLSNNSLCRMAQEAEAEEEEQLRQLQLQADGTSEQAGPWKDNLAGGWDPSHEEYGNDFDTEFHQGFQAAQGGNSLTSVSEKRSQDTPLDLPGGGRAQMVEQTPLLGTSAAGGDPLAAAAAGVITVKNTFLDFDGPSTGVGLRSVRTAGGRLDLLGQMPSPSNFNE